MIQERIRTRRLKRRRRLPLHLGVFLVYILVQYATSSFSAEIATEQSIVHGATRRALENGQAEEVLGDKNGQDFSTTTETVSKLAITS